MSNFVTDDNAFNRAMTKVFDLCVLNVLTVLCCIPIFTAGASLTAMYSIMLKMVKNEEGPIFKSFFKEFKSNFKSSIGGWLILIIAYAVLIFDLQLWTQVEVEYRSIFYGITLVVLVAVCAISTWYFAIRATFEETLKSGFVNASKFAIVYLPFSVLFGIITVGVVYFFLHYPTLVVVMPIFGLALIEYPKALIIRKRFDKYIEQRERTTETDAESEEESAEWNNEADEAKIVEEPMIAVDGTEVQSEHEKTVEDNVLTEEPDSEDDKISEEDEKAEKDEASEEVKKSKKDITEGTDKSKGNKTPGNQTKK